MSELTMQELQPGQVRLDDPESWPAWEPPCWERQVPGVGSTWVHAYTEADRLRWTEAAKALAGGREPTEEHLRAAQAIWVCRVAPGAEAHTFVVPVQSAPEGFRRLLERLPGRWMEEVCLDADRLVMAAYLGEPESDAAEDGECATGEG